MSEDTKHNGAIIGKTILITGASYGIGNALTRYLFKYRVHLVIVARSEDRLIELKKEADSMAAEVTLFTCDFYDQANVRQLATKLRDIRIDYFISNAGKSLERWALESADRFDDYNRTITVNYLAPVQLISHLLEHFKQHRTHIVNVSTYNVLMKTPPKWSAYVSSKKAMHSWFESNKAELAIMNITVSTVYLPLVESRMKDANPRYKRVKGMKMDHAVRVIVQAMTARNYDYKPWWHIPVQIGLTLTSPFWNVYWRRQIKKKLY